jgi:hypothetical protein
MHTPSHCHIMHSGPKKTALNENMPTNTSISYFSLTNHIPTTHPQTL